MLLARSLFIGIVLVAATGVCVGENIIKPPEIGKPAPDFKVTPVGGYRQEPLTLADFKGQTLILEFWGTWCGPCHRAREQLTLLHKEFAGRGLKILGVACERPEVVERYVKEHPVPYQIAVDPIRMISIKYPTGGIPASYVIDANGVLRAFDVVPTRTLIAELLERGTHLTPDRVSDDCEVWVARHRGNAPPKGDGFGDVYDPAKQTGTHLNVSMAELFRGLEEVFGVPIVDETKLTGRYRLELPATKNFDETKAALETKYGISFVKERRKVPVYRVTPIGETRRAE